MRARRAAALGVLLVLTGCASGPPNEPSLPPPRVISGPLAAAGCTGPSPSASRPAEPSLAADPGDPRQLVASWLENPSGMVVAVSHDGGTTWSRSALPGLLTCAGGRYVHTSDPWVSIGHDGTIYVAALATQPATSTGTAHDIVVSVSRDHGTSWDAPVVVETAAAPPVQPDKEAILADPRRPATAYAVWVDYRVTSGVEPSVNQVMFARTGDGGRTWSTPRAIYSGSDETQQNQLLMTAGGVLLDVFAEAASLPGTAHPPPLPVKIRLIRSTDQGKTWSTPVDAARFTYTNAVDPGTGAQLRFFGQDISAASAGNAVYVAWFEDHADFSTILVARSEDAGIHWRAPQVVAREKAEAFLPHSRLRAMPPSDCSGLTSAISSEAARRSTRMSGSARRAIAACTGWNGARPARSTCAPRPPSATALSSATTWAWWAYPTALPPPSSRRSRRVAMAPRMCSSRGSPAKPARARRSWCRQRSSPAGRSGCATGRASERSPSAGYSTVVW